MEQQFENTPVNEQRKTSSKLNFLLGIDLMRQVETNKIEIIGKEKLEKFPHNKPIVFITTHLSDTDVPLASFVLSRYFNIGITHSSTHNPKENLGVYLETLIGGKENFFSVKHKKVNGRETGFFDPNDFIKMQEATKSGKSLIIASSYNAKDTNPQQIGSTIPDNLGYGAVYLAHKIGAILVPIAVNLKPKEQGGRPESEVIIGDYLDLPKIELESFDEAILKEKRLY